jgi:hypothetical protein
VQIKTSIACLLRGKGYAELGINPRQSGARINTENFLNVRQDIEAAVYTAQVLRYRAIVLHGTTWATFTSSISAQTSEMPTSKLWC